MVGNPFTSTAAMRVSFTFFIGDFDDNNKEETLLLMGISNYYGELKRVFCFRENDFALLKEIFSESYLAKIDKKEEVWQESHTKQDSLFK